MIPKIIQYCWFGDKEKSREIQRCMQSWNKLIGYEFYELNDNNCDLKVNKFVKDAVSHGKWAFVSDYFRLAGLYKYGGFYLDTDVQVNTSFDSLLTKKMILGYLYPSCIGTAVIGAEPNHPLLGKLLDLYNDAFWNDSFTSFSVSDFPKEKFSDNNDLFTFALKKFYSTFLLNGQFAELSNLTIFPKESFEVGHIIGTSYTTHKCEGSWTVNDSMQKKMNSIIKKAAATIPLIHLDSLIRHISYVKKSKSCPYYNVYLVDSHRT